MQSEIEDSLIYGRLETAARDLLEKITLWVEKNKPAGPQGYFEIVEVAKGESLQRLEFALPSEFASCVSGGIAASATMQWCVYIPPPGSQAADLREDSDYPPSLAADQKGTGLFRQTFENSYAGGVQNLSAEFGAWRIIVNAKLKDAPESGARRVGFERVLVLDR